MELIPIQGLGAMQAMQPLETEKIAINTDSASFLDVFRSMVDNVVKTNEQVDRDAIDIMLGNIDDLAQVQANITKANTAVELLTTVKNEVLSAYSTIINMQV